MNVICCILSKFYIKPQRESVSDHSAHQLYLIEILHQTTTKSKIEVMEHMLYLIEILHQTTTRMRSL